MPESKLRVRHYHGNGQPTHEHYWVVRVDSNHPNAHKVLMHAFTRYVSSVRSNGALFVNCETVESLLEPIGKAVSRLLEFETKVEVIEESEQGSSC